jgi:hypothetical protein
LSRSSLSSCRWLSPCLFAFTLAFFPRAARPAEGGPTFGGELRLRAEGFDNILDLDKHQDDSYQFYRMRYRLWVEAKPRDDLRLYFRLGGESRWGVFEKDRPAGGAVSEQAGIRDPESRVGLDNAWAEVRLPWAKGLSAKFGRMDLLYGEGFLIADGTPADGSSSTFFDGISLSLKGAKGQADLFTMKVQDEGFGTPARDENLYGLYTHRGSTDVYLLHRTKWGSTMNGASGSREGILHPRQFTTTLGARYARLPESGLQIVLEDAAQIGRYFWALAPVVSPAEKGEKAASVPIYTAQDRAGFGALARLGWISSSPGKAGVEAGGLYLSGDDPQSERYEGWDGYYSEWPKYSDLLVYTLYDNTTRVRPDDAGTWTNLAGGWLEARIKPSAATKLSLRATELFAPEQTAEDAQGRVRGLVTCAQGGIVFSPNLDGQVLGEYFVPGTFYDREAGGVVHEADPAWYGRAQITARF